ncbi:MAG: endonuclease III [Candidatus Dormibacteria bacterium]
MKHDARIGEICDRLAKAYPEAKCALVHTNAFELLVATILSAQCTDERVNMVTPALFRQYPDPVSLASAPVEDVEDCIRSTGFFRAKARSIKGMAQALMTSCGGNVPSTMEELTTLPGVGRKTANVVLGVAFGIPGFPVDTHVSRITNLLGLVDTSDPVKIEQEICAEVPSSEWTLLSLRLILHGRKVCIARHPQCQVCVLSDVCPSARTGETDARVKKQP